MIKPASTMVRSTITIFLILIVSSASTTSSESEKCRVVRKTFMSCLEATLDDLPKRNNDDILWLTFSKSTIPKIKNLNIYPKLTDFHAENSKIETIDDGAFLNLKDLTWIDVSANKIQRVNPKLIENLPSMNHFNLSGNNGLQIPENEAFLISTSLRWLDLQNCGIDKVNSKTFSKLPGLRDISLAWNFLKTIPEDVFINNKGLTSIDLTGNKLKTLSVNMFDGMKTLVIRLEENPWHCDCQISKVIRWSKRNILKGDVKCLTPTVKKWKDITGLIDCPPEKSVL